MRPHHPVHPRAVAQLVAAGVAIVLAAALIGWLQRSTPHADTDLRVPGVATAMEVVTCERSLPDRPTTPEGIEDVDPVGRVPSSAIIECPDEFDGHLVEYIGEVIGDVLRRNGGAWVLLNDDAYALELGPLQTHGQPAGTNSGLSVWLEGDLASLASTPGRHGRRGDVLRIVGIVHRADPEDGGGLTIRAVDGERLDAAVAVKPPLHTAQVASAVVLALLALGLVALERRRAAER